MTQSRREFLQNCGALIVSFSAGSLSMLSAQGQGPFGTHPSHIDPEKLDSWLAVGADGIITAYTGKCDFGQGIFTAQSQLVAEELCVPIGRVKLIQCDTSVCPDQGTTSGSQSTPTNFNSENLALAAATAREALLSLAANRLEEPVEELRLADGVIIGKRGRRVRYEELIGNRHFNLPLIATAKRRSAADWTVLGKPIASLDRTALLTGQFEFVHHAQIPGMLHGRVVRPPEMGGTVAHVDERSVHSVPRLTSNLAAHDFGYLNLTELSLALSRILDSMENMPRYRGHFFNWYDTRGLYPISPHYISSVDSGNLAASLCTVRQGCLALLKQPVLDPSLLTGLRDHALRLRDELPYTLKSQSIMRLLSSLLRQLECRPTDLFFFENVLTEASGLVARIRESLQRENGKLTELRYWERLLGERVNAALAELYALAPWLDPVCEPELRVNLRDPGLEPLVTELSSVPVLAELPDKYERIRELLIERLGSSDPLYPALRRTLLRLLRRLPEARSSVLEMIERLETVAATLP